MKFCDCLIKEIPEAKEKTFMKLKTFFQLKISIVMM